MERTECQVLRRKEIRIRLKEVIRLNHKFIMQILITRFKTVSLPFWIAFFLLIAGVLSLGFIFNDEDGLRIRVGVLKPETSRTEFLLERFKYYAGGDSEIIVYDDEEQMKLDVSAHKLECAYVLSDEEAVAYRSPQTSADKVFDLMAAAVYTEKLAGELGAEALEPFLPGGDAPEEEIQRRADEYLKDGALMRMEFVELSSVGDFDSGNETVPFYRLFKGLTGLAALLPALLYAMGMTTGANKSAEARLGASGVFTAASSLVIFLLVAFFIIASLIVGNFLFPGLVLDFSGELTAAVSLAWALSGAAVLLAAFVPADAFPAAVSFIFIFAAVFGGAVFDMREIIEVAAPVGYLFPNFYYVHGNWVALLIMGTVCGAAAVTVAEKRRSWF